MTFDKIWEIVGPHSQLGETRSRYLHGLLMCAPLGGSMAEVGTYQGYTAKLMILTKPNKRLCIFDTFEGIKKSDPAVDTHVDGEFACGVESVSAVFDDVDSKYIEFHPGLFPDTFRGDLRLYKFAFVHSDTDTYFGTKATLETFWPRMNNGGIILFDDYLFDPCPGVEKALLEWSEKTGVEIMVAPSGGQAFVIKP